MCYKFSAFDLNSADFYVPSVGARGIAVNFWIVYR